MLTELAALDMSSQQTIEATATVPPTTAMMTRGASRENASNHAMMKRTAKNPERHNPTNLSPSFAAKVG